MKSPHPPDQPVPSPTPSPNRYKLTFTQLQMVNENNFIECHILVRNPKTGSSWESEKFYYKMFQVWALEVDGADLELQLFVKMKKNCVKVAYGALHQGADTMYLEQLANPGNRFFIVKYELWRELVFEEEQKEDEKKKNRFVNNSNLFDSFLQNRNEIPRVEHRNFPIKQPRTGTQDQRVGFHGDISIISSVEEPTVQVQQPRHPKVAEKPKPEEQNNHNMTSDERKGFVHHFDDSISLIEEFLNGIKDNQNQNENQNQNQKLNNTPENQRPSAREKEEEKQLSNIKENPNESDEEYRTTAEKWYAEKFSKKKKLKYRKKSTLAPLKDSKATKPTGKAIEITQYNTQFLQTESTVRQMSDMSVDESLRLKSIDFSLSADDSSSKLYRLARNDGDTSSLWYTAISLPSEGLITVQCESEEGELNGCMGSEEMKKGQCPLFDSEGNAIGSFSFKCRSVGNYNAQTQEMLPQGNQDSFVQGNQVKDQPPNVIKEEQEKQLEAEPKIEPVSEPEPQPEPEPQKEQEKNPQPEPKKTQLIEPPKFTIEPEQPPSRLSQRPSIPVSLSKQDQSPPPSAQEKEKEKEKEPEIKAERNNDVDLNQMRKSVRQSRLQRYTTLPNETISNQSLSPPVTAKREGATMKLQTIESIQTKQPNNLHTMPAIGNSFSLGISEHEQSHIWQNPESSLSNRRRNQTGHAMVHHQHQPQYQYEGYTNEMGHDENLIQSKVTRNSLSNRHKIDFKIERIQVFPAMPNYDGKMIRMEIERNVYYTETSKALYFLDWESKGYFFQGISKFSILRMKLLEQIDGIQNQVGRCNIHLPFLKTDTVNQVLQYQDYIRQQDESQIGRLKLQYRIIDKTKTSSKPKYQNLSSSYTLNYLNEGQIPAVSHRPPKKKTPAHNLLNSYRFSTEVSSRANDSFSVRDFQRKGSYFHQDIRGSNVSPYSRNRNRSPLSKRKYTGGNRIIPKAGRFIEENMNHKLKKGDPGPGAYEVSSPFDRHATPL